MLFFIGSHSSKEFGVLEERLLKEERAFQVLGSSMYDTNVCIGLVGFALEFVDLFFNHK